jgi:ArsR family transcriptional regulator
MASAPRRHILEILGGPDEPDKTCCGPREVCACRISEALGLTAQTVSHHMRVLTSAGLVSARRDGRWVYYTLERDVLAAVADELARF